MATPGDLYQVLLEQNNRQSEHHAETMRELGRMNAQIDSLLAEAKKTNGRVTKLENFKHYFVGVAAAFGIVGSSVWQWITGGR